MKIIFKVFLLLTTINFCIAQEQESNDITTNETITDLTLVAKIEQTRSAARSYVDKKIQEELATTQEQVLEEEENNNSIDDNKI